jgi:hypothetical protein
MLNRNYQNPEKEMHNTSFLNRNLHEVSEKIVFNPSNPSPLISPAITPSSTNPSWRTDTPAGAIAQALYEDNIIDAQGKCILPGPEKMSLESHEEALKRLNEILAFDFSNNRPLSIRSIISTMHMKGFSDLDVKIVGSYVPYILGYEMFVEFFKQSLNDKGESLLKDKRIDAYIRGLCSKKPTDVDVRFLLKSKSTNLNEIHDILQPDLGKGTVITGAKNFYVKGGLNFIIFPIHSSSIDLDFTVWQSEENPSQSPKRGLQISINQQSFFCNCWTIYQAFVDILTQGNEYQRPYEPVYTLTYWRDLTEKCSVRNRDMTSAKYENKIWIAIIKKAFSMYHRKHGDHFMKTYLINAMVDLHQRRALNEELAKFIVEKYDEIVRKSSFHDTLFAALASENIDVAFALLKTLGALLVDSQDHSNKITVQKGVHWDRDHTIYLQDGRNQDGAVALPYDLEQSLSKILDAQDEQLVPFTPLLTLFSTDFIAGLIRKESSEAINTAIKLCVIGNLASEELFKYLLAKDVEKATLLTERTNHHLTLSWCEVLLKVSSQDPQGSDQIKSRVTSLLIKQDRQDKMDVEQLEELVLHSYHQRDKNFKKLMETYSKSKVSEKWDEETKEPLTKLRVFWFIKHNKIEAAHTEFNTLSDPKSCLSQMIRNKDSDLPTLAQFACHDDVFVSLHTDHYHRIAAHWPSRNHLIPILSHLLSDPSHDQIICATWSKMTRPPLSNDEKDFLHKAISTGVARGMDASALSSLIAQHEQSLSTESFYKIFEYLISKDLPLAIKHYSTLPNELQTTELYWKIIKKSCEMNLSLTPEWLKKGVTLLSLHPLEKSNLSDKEVKWFVSHVHDELEQKDFDKAYAHFKPKYGELFNDPLLNFKTALQKREVRTLSRYFTQVIENSTQPEGMKLLIEYMTLLPTDELEKNKKIELSKEAQEKLAMQAQQENADPNLIINVLTLSLITPSPIFKELWISVIKRSSKKSMTALLKEPMVTKFREIILKNAQKFGFNTNVDKETLIATYNMFLQYIKGGAKKNYKTIIYLYTQCKKSLSSLTDQAKIKILHALSNTPNQESEELLVIKALLSTKEKKFEITPQDTTYLFHRTEQVSKREPLVLVPLLFKMSNNNFFGEKSLKIILNCAEQIFNREPGDLKEKEQAANYIFEIIKNHHDFYKISYDKLVYKQFIRFVFSHIDKFSTDHTKSIDDRIIELWKTIALLLCPTIDFWTINAIIESFDIISGTYKEVEDKIYANLLVILKTNRPSSLPNWEDVATCFRILYLENIYISLKSTEDRNTKIKTFISETKKTLPNSTELLSLTKEAVWLNELTVFFVNKDFNKKTEEKLRNKLSEHKKNLIQIINSLIVVPTSLLPPLLMYTSKFYPELISDSQLKVYYDRCSVYTKIERNSKIDFSTAYANILEYENGNTDSEPYLTHFLDYVTKHVASWIKEDHKFMTSDQTNLASLVLDSPIFNKWLMDKDARAIQFRSELNRFAEEIKTENPDLSKTLKVMYLGGSAKAALTLTRQTDHLIKAEYIHEKQMDTYFGDEKDWYFGLYHFFKNPSSQGDKLLFNKFKSIKNKIKNNELKPEEMEHKIPGTPEVELVLSNAYVRYVSYEEGNLKKNANELAEILITFIAQYVKLISHYRAIATALLNASKDKLIKIQTKIFNYILTWFLLENRANMSNNDANYILEELINSTISAYGSLKNEKNKKIKDEQSRELVKILHLIRFNATEPNSISYHVNQEAYHSLCRFEAENIQELLRVNTRGNQMEYLNEYLDSFINSTAIALATRQEKFDDEHKFALSIFETLQKKTPTAEMKAIISQTKSQIETEMKYTKQTILKI